MEHPLFPVVWPAGESGNIARTTGDA